MSRSLCFALCLALASAWIDDPVLRARTEAEKRVAVPRFTLNLDLPAAERWLEIAALYKDRAPGLISYLKENIPAWALPIVQKIGADVRPYFRDYGDEILGLSKGLGVPVGDLVALNLVYQIEHIGVNCSEWNNTGPVGDDDAVEPSWKKGCDPKTKWTRTKSEDGPGLCTSILSEDSEGHIWHGRNLDWNLDPLVKVLTVDVDYQRSNKTVFTGTTLVGFVGVVNGIRPGAWSYSLDAREKGGSLVDNFFEALLTEKARTPCQHARFVLESEEATDWSSAVKALSTSPLINDAYFIVGGVKAGEGVVIARDRNQAHDQWFLNQSIAEGNGFFQVETNYDHDKPVPKADDRRTNATLHMKTLGLANVGMGSMTKIMETWPTFNHHTDYTGVFAPFNATYTSGYWMRD
jgi:N-acylethanolamine-hydrolysing acid amidase